MVDDSELLRRYAEERSDEAFTELVRRHVGWVYRTSLRRTGGRSDLTQEAAQNVFSVLARKAKALRGREMLGGWLYTTARYAAAQIMRAERRRQLHETEAAAMSLREQMGGLPPDADASELRNALIRELDRLPERDREAIRLRYFEDRTFAEIGGRLRMGEDAARKRVERSLGRLSGRLSRGGSVSSGAALAALLAEEASGAVPVHLSATVAQVALGGIAHGVSTVAVLQLMSATKSAGLAAALIGLAGVIGIGTAAVAVYEVKQDRSDRAALAATMDRCQAEEQALRDLQQQTAAATRQAAAARARMERIAATGSAPSTTANSPRDPAVQRADPAAKARKDGQAFLAAYGQARPMLMELSRYQIARNLAPYFKQAGLTPEQVDALETATAQRWIDTLALTPNQMHPGEGSLPDEQAAAIIGNSGLQLYKDAQRWIPAENWAATMAAAAAEGGSPLSADQVAALAQSVANNSPDFANGQSVKAPNVNWQNVLAQARQNLDPAQWGELQATLQWQALAQQAMAIAKQEPAP